MHTSGAAIVLKTPFRAPFTMFRLWVLLCLILNAAKQRSSAEASEDVANVSPCELESIINHLVYPSSENRLHAAALRSQLKNILRDREMDVGEDQSISDYDYIEDDKRSLASLAAQGLIHPGSKRSLATLAKNGQLPTPEPEYMDSSPSEEKRYIGSLARSGGFMSYGKRNVGSLARDYQLPQNGKRNLATLARLGLLSPATNRNEAKRNVAAVARYNSNRLGAANAAEKRNLGALKASPVHGAFQQQKRDNEQMLLPSMAAPNVEMDYSEVVPNYWMYPSYADMDWGDFGRAQKRFLGRVLPPTRATASTNRSRL